MALNMRHKGAIMGILTALPVGRIGTSLLLIDLVEIILKLFTEWRFFNDFLSNHNHLISTTSANCNVLRSVGSRRSARKCQHQSGNSIRYG